MSTAKYLAELEALLDLKDSLSAKNDGSIKEATLLHDHTLSDTSELMPYQDDFLTKDDTTVFSLKNTKDSAKALRLGSKSKPSTFKDNEEPLPARTECCSLPLEDANYHVRLLPHPRTNISIEELFMEIEAIENEAQSQRIYEAKLKDKRSKL